MTTVTVQMWPLIEPVIYAVAPEALLVTRPPFLNRESWRLGLWVVVLRLKTPHPGWGPWEAFPGTRTGGGQGGDKGEGQGTGV